MLKKKVILLLLTIIIYLIIATLFTYAFYENLILLSISEFCVLLASIVSFWILFRLFKADRVSTTCLEMLNEQDFSARLRRVGYPESDRMIDLYNRMIAELREQRIQIINKSELINLLIENDTMGIIIFDFNMLVSLVNPAAIKFLQLPANQLIGQSLKKFDKTLVKALSQLTLNIPQVVEVGGINRYRCSLLYFYDRGFRRYFITIEELTHELITAEKSAAEKIIRTMSHEVNNTLSSINSNLNLLLGLKEYFPEKLRTDIIRALQLSIERSDNLCRLVSSFSDIVKLPLPSPIPVSLNTLVENTVSLLSGKFNEAGINCVLQLCEKSPLINADIVQMEQVLINIMINALEASENNKGDVIITTTCNPSKLTIRDYGCGIPEENRNEIFKPFFSTKNGGQGIGLMLVSEILLNHKFSFDLTTKEGYTEFKILF